MDREKLWDILQQIDVRYDYPEGHTPEIHPEIWLDIEAVKTAVDAIAQAHEQEMGELERQVVKRVWKSLTELRGQVAVMAEALRLHDEFRDATYDSGYYAANKGSGDKLLIDAIARRNALTKRMRAALQSAPKVLWEGESEIEADGVLRIHGAILPKRERQQVKIIVLEGPTALQEQSKAQEPDKECSVVGKQGQSSEQGYKRARGIIPWKEGDELPEDTIARLRGRESEQDE